MSDDLRQDHDSTAKDGLDRALLSLATKPGDPWLARRVETELAARAQARAWLRENPRGVLSFGAAPLLTRRMAVHTALVLMAGVCGGAATALPAVAAQLPLPVMLMLGTGFGAALAAAAALRWNELRGVFTS